MDSRFVRGKAFNQILLAVAHVQQRQVEQACAEGRTAVDTVAELSSGRAVGYIRDLRRRLRPYGADAVVRDFNEHAVTKLPVLEPAERRAGHR